MRDEGHILVEADGEGGILESRAQRRPLIRPNCIRVGCEEIEVNREAVAQVQLAPFCSAEDTDFEGLIKLEADRKETFTHANYSWTEHISHKSGQWWSDPKELLDQMEKCGFVVRTKE